MTWDLFEGGLARTSNRDSKRLYKIQRLWWRQRPEIEDFCRLSWLNVQPTRIARTANIHFRTQMLQCLSLKVLLAKEITGFRGNPSNPSRFLFVWRPRLQKQTEAARNAVGSPSGLSAIMESKVIFCNPSQEFRAIQVKFCNPSDVRLSEVPFVPSNVFLT